MNKIFGIGFGRTGSKSLKTSLEMLGYSPCLHTEDIIKNSFLQMQLDYKSQGKLISISQLMFSYKSSTLWDLGVYWKQILKKSNDSKFILTIRDPEEWYRSASQTILPGLQEVDSHHELNHTYILLCRKVFNSKFDKDSAIKAYLKWNEEIQNGIPKDRLLVYNVKDGWDPLCNFLEKGIPNFDFPFENTTEEFLKTKNLYQTKK